MLSVAYFWLYRSAVSLQLSFLFNVCEELITFTQILSALNFSNITLKFGNTAIFVYFAYKQYLVHNMQICL